MFAILGATGKIGGAVVRQLRQRELPVRAIVRDSTKSEALIREGCEISVADIRNEESLKRGLSGADDLLVICPMNPKAVDAGVEHERLTDTITKALEQIKPRRLVAISDYGAQHETGTGITLIFHRFEQKLRSLPARVTILRSAEHMQNWARYLQRVMTDGVLPIFYQPADRPLPYVSAPDVGVVAAEILLAQSSKTSVPEIVHVEGPRRYSVNDVIDIMQRLLGCAVVGQEVARQNGIQLLIAAGLGESYAQLVTKMWDAHNAGKIELEPGGEVRCGTTSLDEVLKGQLARI